MVINKKSNNKRSKVPKIKAPFKVVVIEVEKGKANLVSSLINGKNIFVNIILFGISQTSADLKLLSISNREVEVLYALVPAEKVNEGFSSTLCKFLEDHEIYNVKVYVINPSSADLNLIYQIGKAV